MNVDYELKRRASEIEEIIMKYTPAEKGLQKLVIEAMNYSLMAGGKRLRPMLMQETFRLFGGENQCILEPFMAAIEMVHTYSLVHDDLPCMDNDEYRRGRKTTHVVYGEAMALLAGDSLLTYAFETATGAIKYAEYSDPMDEIKVYKRILRAINILSVKSGIHGMIGGQVIDMEENKANMDLKSLNIMYLLKTGALMEASMMIGAVLAGAEEEQVLQIEKIAADIGLAFQIKDDILDITSSSEVLGKPVHSDERNEKLTYTYLMTIDEAEEQVRVVSERAVQGFNALGKENQFLKALIIQLIGRQY